MAGIAKDAVPIQTVRRYEKLFSAENRETAVWWKYEALVIIHTFCYVLLHFVSSCLIFSLQQGATAALFIRVHLC